MGVPVAEAISHPALMIGGMMIGSMHLYQSCCPQPQLGLTTKLEASIAVMKSVCPAWVEELASDVGELIS
jgi:hypothetical protein